MRILGCLINRVGILPFDIISPKSEYLNVPEVVDALLAK